MPQKEKNYYIIIPYNEDSLAWMLANKNAIRNIGDNEVINAMFYPDKNIKPLEIFYLIELKKQKYDELAAELSVLGADPPLTAAEWQIKFPNTDPYIPQADKNNPK